MHRALSGLRVPLRRNGVACILHGQIAELPDAGGWLAAAGPEPGRLSAFERQLTALVEGEVEAAARSAGRRRVRTVVLSSDCLIGAANLGVEDSSVFRPAAESALRQVINALDARDVRVVFYTHRQDRLMELCYSRSVLNGQYHEFAAQFPYRFEPRLDYVELLERLRGIPAVSQIAVRPYELIEAGPAAFVADFLSTCGVAAPLDFTRLAKLAVRRVLTAQGLAVALGMNPHLDSAEERRIVRGFLLQQFGTDEDAPARFLPEEERAHILAAYADRNRELFRRHLPELPENSYLSDDATAALAHRIVAPIPPAATGLRAALRRGRRGLRHARRLGSRVQISNGAGSG